MLGDFCFLEFMAHRKQVSSVLADPDKLKAAQQAVEAMRRQMLSPRSLAVIKLARRMTAAEAPETEVPEASIAEAPAAPMAEVAQATEVPIYAWHSGDRNPAIGLGFQDWGERLQQEVQQKERVRAASSTAPGGPADDKQTHEKRPRFEPAAPTQHAPMEVEDVAPKPHSRCEDLRSGSEDFDTATLVAARRAMHEELLGKASGYQRQLRHETKASPPRPSRCHDRTSRPLRPSRRRCTWRHS